MKAPRVQSKGTLPVWFANPILQKTKKKRLIFWFKYKKKSSYANNLLVTDFFLCWISKIACWRKTVFSKAVKLKHFETFMRPHKHVCSSEHIQLHIHRLHIKTLEDQFTNSNQDTSFATQMKSLAKSMAQSLQDWLVIVECMRFWPETFTMCNLFPFSTYDGFPAD